MNKNLISYYRDRANEYEKIYAKPERQEDIQRSTRILQDLFKNKNVFEIACGTGYWTQKIIKTASYIFATDINTEVIEVAKQKDFLTKRVSFGVADIFQLSLQNTYESVFGGFIWSHILLQDLEMFVKAVYGLVEQGGIVVFMDNNYVEGSSHPITRTDDAGNTYQTRKLENGSTHLVLKNFPTEKFLREKLSGNAIDIQFFDLEYYWILIYKLPHTKSEI